MERIIKMCDVHSLSRKFKKFLYLTENQTEKTNGPYLKLEFKRMIVDMCSDTIYLENGNHSCIAFTLVEKIAIEDIEGVAAVISIKCESGTYYIMAK